MDDFKKFLSEIETDSQDRFNNYRVEDMENLAYVEDEAYLEEPTWLKSKEKIACLAIDLTGSTKLSARKNPNTMAKLYDYFTQNIVNILNEERLKADYQDIKGDGVFALYEGNSALEKAFVGGVLFKTYFENYIVPKFKKEFNIELQCKISINEEKALVKRIGKRKFGNRDLDNEVWAGTLVNSAYELLSLYGEIKEGDTNFLSQRSLVIIPEEIYEYYSENYRDIIILSCGCEGRERSVLWKKFNVPTEKQDTLGTYIYYGATVWCNNCGDECISGLID